jgi:hypothetical protein
MALTPFNFIMAFHLEPVYGWEDVEQDTGAAPPPITPVVDALDPTQIDYQVQPIPTTTIERQLVFKGYEWRPGAESVLFPDRWERSVLDSATDRGAEPSENSEAENLKEELRLRSARIAAARLEAQLGDTESNIQASSTDVSEDSES